MTTPTTVTLSPIVLCPVDVEYLREAHAKTPTAWVRLLPKQPRVTVGQRLWVREPFRLLVRSYSSIADGRLCVSSTVVYADGRIAANYMDVPLEERDAATFLDTSRLMDAVPTFGAEYTANVQAAGGVTSSIRFHPARKMPEWAARWEIEVLDVREHWTMRVRPIERHRVTEHPREWTSADVQRVTRLWARLQTAGTVRKPLDEALAQIVWSIYCSPSTGRVRVSVPEASRTVLQRYLSQLPKDVRHSVAARVTQGLQRRTVNRQSKRSRAHLDALVRWLTWDAPETRSTVEVAS